MFAIQQPNRKFLHSRDFLQDLAQKVKMFAHILKRIAISLPFRRQSGLGDHKSRKNGEFPRCSQDMERICDGSQRIAADELQQRSLEWMCGLKKL
jgi:hypothetical protein